MCWFYKGIAQIALDPTPCPKPSWQALAPLGNVGKKYPKPSWQAFTPSPFKAIGAMPIWKQHISKRGIQRCLERYREWGERRRARRRTLSGLDRREIWRQLLSGLALQLNSTAIRLYTVDNSGTTEASFKHYFHQITCYASRIVQQLLTSKNKMEGNKYKYQNNSSLRL